MTLANKTVMDPGLTDTLTNLKQDIFRSMNCVKVGQIQSFDLTKKTATVKLLFKRVLPGGTNASYPILVDCPIVTIQGGGGAIQFPIQSGDQCLVFFADRNIDAWFKTGSESAPLNGRSHDLSDGFALVGINSLTSSLESYMNGKARFFFDGAEIDLSAGIVTIKNQVTSLLLLLEGLIDVIKAVSTDPGGGPLNGASQALLEAYKLQMEQLLS